MFLSHKNKFIFFHAEKSAGTFIEKSLCKAFSEEQWKATWACKEWENGKGKNLEGQHIKHLRPDDLREAWGPKFDLYDTWTTVRDPWGQMVSLYYMMTQWPKYASIRGHHFKMHGRIHPLNDYENINEWIHLASQGVGPRKAVMIFRRFCNYHTKFQNGLVKNIIRFDDLQTGVSKMCETLKIREINCKNVVHKIADNGETFFCTSEHRRVTEELTEYSAKIIASLCSRDIQEFGFKNPFG